MTVAPYLPQPTGPSTTSQNSIPAMDPAAMESAAQQVSSASYTSYGALPNPQAVYEAAQTGATATLAQLALMGTPEYAAELTGSPAGGQVQQTPFPQTTAQPPPQATGNTGVYGAAPTAAQQKQAIQSSGNSQWAALGSVPSTNLAWMQSIEDSKDPSQIKQWQTMLSANGGGFYGANTGNHISGVWNSTTDTAALQGFLIARYMPDALYSSDPTTATNASQFLSALGVDTTAMQQQMRDPVMQASVAQQWMMAQGPNAGQTTNSLQQYADKYGLSALPTGYQAIVRPDPLRSIRDGLLNLPLLGLLNDVPLASSVFHGAVNLLTGNLDLGHLLDDPRNVEAQQVKSQMQALNKMTPTDLQNMTPLLQSIANDSGFMGFMDSWDHDRNSVILEVGSTLVNGFSKGKWENPFDPTSAANIWAQAHADNMAGVLFGDQWAQNNPFFAGMANFIINTADDPTSYLGLLGKVPMIAMAQNMGTASKVLDDTKGPFLGLRSLFGTLKDPETRKVWGDLAGNGLKEQTSDGWMKTARAAVKPDAGGKIRLSTIDAAEGFAIPKVGSEAAGKYALVKAILEAPDDATARGLMMNGSKDGETMGFGHLTASGKAVYNTHANWASVVKAAASGKLNHARAIGALPEMMNDALVTDPVKTLSNFRNRALVSGMTPAEYGPLNEKLADAILGRTGDVEGAVAAAKEYTDAILKANEEKFGVTRDMLDKVRAYRYKSSGRTPPAQDEKNVYAPKPDAPTGAAAPEISTGTRASGDARAVAQERINVINSDLKELEAHAKPDDPHILALQNELTTLQRPVPMFTTQLADLYQFPYTPYEMLVARHPTMRFLEKTQAAVRADEISGVWKRWAIGRISSAYRIVLGDDTIRPVTLLISTGHPITGFRLLGMSLLRSLGITDPTAGLAAIGRKIPGVRNVVGDFGGVTRARVLARTEEILAKDPNARRLMQEFGNLVNETIPHGFQSFHPTEVGYAQGLHHVIQNILAPDPLVQSWLKAYEEGALGTALAPLEALPKSSFYHGTSMRMAGDQLRPAYEAGSGANNLFGPGVYVTDNPGIAEAYTRKGLARASAKGEASKTVYGMEPTKKLNLIDLSKPLPADAQQAFLNSWKGVLGPDYDLSELAAKMKTTPGDEIYKELRGDLSDAEIPKYDADEILQEMHDALSGKGYHGFQYQGGKYTGKTPHTASVIFDPESLKVSHITSRDPVHMPVNLKGLDAARAAVEDTVRKATSKGAEMDPVSARIASWLNVQNGDLGEENFQAVLNRWHSYASGLFRNEQIRQWTREGAPDFKKVHGMVKNEANLNASTLPVISSRIENGYAQNMLSSGVTKFPQLIFNEITKPSVDSARANGFVEIKDLYDKSIRKYYDKTSYAARADYAAMVEKEASSQAMDWMLNNTYQGGRSIVGGTLRNVMPFYGATANLDRFIWRQAMAHPAVGVGAVRAMNASEESQVNTTAPALTGGSGFMAMLGFGGGEGLQFNPMNAFFLTADGLGSVIPGTGPVFTPLWKGISSVSPGLSQLLSTIPGISQEIDWSTGNAQPLFPWLSDLLQGAAMSAFGTGNVVTDTLENLPGIGVGADKVSQLMIQKEQQDDRNKTGSGVGGTTTQGDIQNVARDVGHDLVAQGAAQFVAPVSPQVKDVGGQQITQQMDTYRAATTDAQKDLAITQALGVKPKQWQAALDQTPGAPSVAQLVARHPDSAGALMVYQDSRISSDMRDAVQAAAPWVVSSAAGKYQYTSTQTVGDLAQWDLMRNMGDINVLSPFGNQNSFLSKVTDERQVNNAWLQYDQLKNLEYSTMAQNGWSTSSPLYQAWNDAVMQPALVKMETEFPAWATKFGSGGGGTSASSLAGATAPLRTLQTWEAIPQNPDFETQTSTSWRNAIQAKDQAAAMIYQLNQSGGSPTETQMVMTQLQNQLQQLAAQDPQFQAELGSYSFGKWEDVVNLEADEQLANYYAQTTVSAP
jgi:hypothetical protein